MTKASPMAVDFGDGRQLSPADRFESLRAAGAFEYPIQNAMWALAMVAGSGRETPQTFWRRWSAAIGWMPLDKLSGIAVLAQMERELMLDKWPERMLRSDLLNHVRNIIDDVERMGASLDKIEKARRALGHTFTTLVGRTGA